MSLLTDRLAELEQQKRLSSVKPKGKGFFGKASDLLDKPEQLAREGLTSIADAVPSFDLSKPAAGGSEFTRNITQNAKLIGNIPKFAAETLAETAPEFLSKEALLTGGTLRGVKASAPAIKTAGRFVGQTAENLSGLGSRVPGVLAELTNRPGLLFAPGVEKARKAFQNAKQGLDPIRDDLKKIKAIGAFVSKSVDLAKKGTLNAVEALESRKALDMIKKRVSPVFFREAREILDGIAKTKFSGADKVFQDAIKADSLRRALPIGKGGDVSQVRSIGSFALGGGQLLAGLSPILQGATASGVGVARKLATPFINVPTKGLALKAIDSLFRGDESPEGIQNAKETLKQLFQ